MFCAYPGCMSDVYLHPLPRTGLPTRVHRGGDSRLVTTLAGHDTWGCLRTGYARQSAQYRLGIYPPGVTARDRLHLRVWYDCPIWSLGVAFGTWTVTTVLAGPVVASIVAAIVTAALIGWSAHTATPIRQQVRWLDVWVENDDDLGGLRAKEDLIHVADRLRDDDRALRAGEISPDEHEIRWARMYSSLV